MIFRIFAATTVLASAQSLTWEQLREKFECPAWFADAKFGIWAHYGAQSKPPMGGGWVARHIYMPDVGPQKFGKNAYPWHVENYGHPSEIGWKDVIHSWKAAKLDTDALLTYYKSIGAKYFVAMANHHDHFDNFDSSHHPWNSVNIGPKRDLIGEFEKSTRKVGLPFGVSSHDDRFLDWWLPAFAADTEGPKKGRVYDGRLTKADGAGKWWEGLDPADLYGLPPEKRSPHYVDKVGKNFALRHIELIDKYRPDFLWFDGYGFPWGDHGKRVSTHFYDQAFARDGRIDVVLAGKFTDEPSTISDIERGVSDVIRPVPWQGTTTFTGWFYKKDEANKHNARTLIEVLCDIVSKNGNLLLSAELLPDGTIPPEQKTVLDELGNWLRINGEAIFGTRPWAIHGDNLNSIQKRLEESAINAADLEALRKRAKSKHFNERTLQSPPYGHDEVRFTTKGDTLYVHVLNPAPGPITLNKLRGMRSGKWTLLGSDMAVSFEPADGVLTVPAERPTPHALVFRYQPIK